MIAMTELMTPEELARVGLAPLPGHSAIKRALGPLLQWCYRIGSGGSGAGLIAGPVT